MAGLGSAVRRTSHLAKMLYSLLCVKLDLRSFLCPFSYQDINGEVQDLSKLAGEAEYVKSGCGAACENNSCKNHAKCLDNYNVYLCDCSKTPYYGYFCHKGKLYCWRVVFFLVSCCSGIRPRVVSNSWRNVRVDCLNTHARGKFVVHALDASLVSSVPPIWFA